MKQSLVKFETIIIVSNPNNEFFTVGCLTEGYKCFLIVFSKVKFLLYQKHFLKVLNENVFEVYR